MNQRAQELHLGGPAADSVHLARALLSRLLTTLVATTLCRPYVRMSEWSEMSPERSPLPDDVAKG
jgi:hypothetical protein